MADSWGYYNYQGVGASRLTSYLTQHQQPTNFIEALLTPFRDLEQLHHALFDMLNIYRTTGQGLDAFGEMMNVMRLGRSDEAYRQAILARRFSSGGSGTWPEVRRAVLAMATSAKVRKVDHFPAAYVAIITGTANVDKSLPKSLFDLSVAGVHPHPTHDYGQGGFELSGVSGVIQNVLGAAPADDEVIGADKTKGDQVIGINAVAGTLGGTPLAGVIETSQEDYGSRARGAMMFGAFPDYQA